MSSKIFNKKLVLAKNYCYFFHILNYIIDFCGIFPSFRNIKGIQIRVIAELWKILFNAIISKFYIMFLMFHGFSESIICGKAHFLDWILIRDTIITKSILVISTVKIRLHSDGFYFLNTFWLFTRHSLAITRRKRSFLLQSTPNICQNPDGSFLKNTPESLIKSHLQRRIKTM